MTRRHRLRGRRRFAMVRQCGVEVRSGSVRVRALAGPGEMGRAGLAVTGARTAVVRNRARRRLRAIVAPLLLRADGVDLVLSAPASSAEQPFADLARDVGDAVGRAVSRANRR